MTRTELLPIAYKDQTKLDAFILVFENNYIRVSYTLSHPDNIIGNKDVYQALRSCNKKCYIVLNEARCILDWREEFRPIFKIIKQLRAVCKMLKCWH